MGVSKCHQGFVECDGGSYSGHIVRETSPVDGDTAGKGPMSRNPIEAPPAQPLCVNGIRIPIWQSIHKFQYKYFISAFVEMGNLTTSVRRTHVEEKRTMSGKEQTYDTMRHLSAQDEMMFINPGSSPKEVSDNGRDRAPRLFSPLSPHVCMVFDTNSYVGFTEDCQAKSESLFDDANADDMACRRCQS